MALHIAMAFAATARNTLVLDFGRRHGDHQARELLAARLVTPSKGFIPEAEHNSIPRAPCMHPSALPRSIGKTLILQEFRWVR